VINKTQVQFQLDPLLPYHLISPMLRPPETAAATVHEETNSEQKQPTSATEDIDSENFIGRNLLLKMGWEKGIKLGKSGAADEGPIAMLNQQDKSGLGLRREQDNEARLSKRKSSEDIRTSRLEVTRRRYDS
jgi:hypothetical protein